MNHWVKALKRIQAYEERIKKRSSGVHGSQKRKVEQPTEDMYDGEGIRSAHLLDGNGKLGLAIDGWNTHRIGK